jgi:DNA-binding NarL/FixJ family response regulator
VGGNCGQQKVEQIMVRFVIVDDHPLFVHGLADRLRGQEQLVFAGSAANGEAAKRLLANTLPDIVIIELCLPDISGVDLSVWLRKKLPAVRVLWTASFVSGHYIGLARTLGVKGFVAKQNNSASFAQAIRRVCDGGEIWLLPSNQRALGSERLDRNVAQSADLTARQKQIAGLVAAGLVNKEIAERLQITKRTVDTHRHLIYRKLHLRGTAELTRYCIEHFR